MRLLLVRHAVTPETGTVLSGRLPGIGLSGAGHDAARELANWLKGVRVHHLVTSPVRRCRETARHLAAVWDLPVATDRRLIEADYGRWSGRKLAQLGRTKAWSGLMTSASRFRFPEGETLREVQTRAVGAVEGYAAEHARHTVAAVSHADVIRTVLAHYLGMPLDLIHRLHVAPTSVSIVELGAGPPMVPVVNRTIGPVW